MPLYQFLDPKNFGQRHIETCYLTDPKSFKATGEVTILNTLTMRRVAWHT